MAETVLPDGTKRKRKSQQTLDSFLKRKNPRPSLVCGDSRNIEQLEQNEASKQVPAASVMTPMTAAAVRDATAETSNSDVTSVSSVFECQDDSNEPIPSSDSSIFEWNEASENITNPLVAADDSSCSFTVTSVQGVEIKIPITHPLDTLCLDIGLYLNMEARNITELRKAELLTNHWKPPAGYIFPCSTHNKSGKPQQRYLNQGHLDKYGSWLVLSEEKKGLICIFCALFGPEEGGGNRLGQLVKTPLKQFNKLTGHDGKLSSHDRAEYHKVAIERGKAFLKSFNEPKADVRNQVDRQRKKNVQENRERLLPIVKTIIFCGRQNIALRGHRENRDILDGIQDLVDDVEENERIFDSSVSCDRNKEDNDVGSSIVSNDGNFRELLRFRIDSGDVKLEEHLKNASSRATYIGKSIQNELIACCGEEIRDTILERVRKAEYYTVIFDETTDISNLSQMSLCLAYVHNDCRHEDFISFVDVFDSCFDGSEKEPVAGGNVLGQLVVTVIEKLGLDLNKWIGTGTDGCAVMASDKVGAVAEIKKFAKNAIRYPCFNHALNLSVSKTSTVPSIRNSISTVKEIIAFLTSSAKRHHVFKQKGGSKLKKLCETRWVERGESVSRFLDEFVAIHDVLSDIANNWRDSGAAGKAAPLLAALKNPEFLIALYSQLDVLLESGPLSRLLQKKDLDMSQATTEVENLLGVLREHRTNADKEFAEIFRKSAALLNDLDVDIKLPRVNRRQTHRPNMPAKTAEEYYKFSIYIPMLDSVTTDLEDRFGKEQRAAFELFNLLPNNLKKLDPALLKDLAKKLTSSYGDLITNDSCQLESRVAAELRLWQKKCSGASLNLPSAPSASTVLSQCDIDVYPLIHKLLRILLTLPVSVATAERSFSSLKRIKTWLRNRIGQERLNGLALLNIHYEIPVDPEKVIDRFANKKDRRLDFLIK
jgi:hypothetical protein